MAVWSSGSLRLGRSKFTFSALSLIISFLMLNFLSNRYSDFLVNEIDPDGVIVRLTDLSEPVDHSLPPQVSKRMK